MSDIELEPEPTTPSPSNDGSTAGRTIKRYTNRKHYDSVERRYVTLQEIAALVRRGIEFRVVDNYSKEDLTSATLSQIVFEGEKRNAQLPLGLLQRLIRGAMEVAQWRSSTAWTVRYRSAISRPPVHTAADRSRHRLILQDQKLPATAGQDG